METLCPIYVAGKFQAREYLISIMDKIREFGFYPCSRWMFIDWSNGRVSELITHSIAAQMDVDDLRRASAFLLIDEVVHKYDERFKSSDVTGGRESVGRYVELGIALERGIPIAVVGQPRSVFHKLDSVLVTENLNAALHFLQDRGRGPSSCDHRIGVGGEPCDQQTPVQDEGTRLGNGCTCDICTGRRTGHPLG